MLTHVASMARHSQRSSYILNPKCSGGSLTSSVATSTLRRKHEAVLHLANACQALLTLNSVWRISDSKKYLVSSCKQPVLVRPRSRSKLVKTSSPQGNRCQRHKASKVREEGLSSAPLARTCHIPAFCDNYFLPHLLQKPRVTARSTKLARSIDPRPTATDRQ